MMNKSLYSDRKKRIEREDYGIVLDFLQHGHLSSGSRRPVAQIIGINHLSLLEVVPKKGVFLKPLSKVYIGPQKREKIHHISHKITYDDLTETAKMNAEDLVTKVVNKDLNVVVELFNKAGPVSTRQHSLELIPGIGKKHMWAIIEERDKKPFVDIEDLKNRVSLIPDPVKSVVKRAIDELIGVDKYKIILPRLNLKEVSDKV